MAEGIIAFAEAVACAGEAAQKLSGPVVLPALQGKALRGKGSITADLIFGYFSSRKSNKPPGGD